MSGSNRPVVGVQPIGPDGEPRKTRAEKDAERRALKARRAAEERAERDLLYRETYEQMRALKSQSKLPDDAAPEYFLNARERLAMPPQAIECAVDSLARTGAVVTLPSSRKTGKTTFLANLAVDGLTGRPFLGKFGTHLSVHTTIVVLNAEMLAADYEATYRKLDPANSPEPDLNEDNPAWIDPYERLYFLHCRDEGLRINLLNDHDAQWLVRYCTRREAAWLFLDPWKDICGWAGVGINDNDGVNRLAQRLREVQAAADLEMVVVPMHTTQNRSEDGYERGKGAGELEDGADALWRYVKDGPQDSPRFLSVTGRGVGVDEQEVTFDPVTQRITLGTHSRSESRERRDAEPVLTALEMALADLPDGRTALNRRELEAVCPGSDRDKSRKINAAISQGLITARSEGKGKPTWYSPTVPAGTKLRPGRKGGSS